MIPRTAAHAPSRESAAEFWSWFTRHEDELRYPENDPRAWSVALDQALRAVHPGLRGERGPIRSGRQVLVLRGEGGEASAAAAALGASAPDLARWTIAVAPPRSVSTRSSFLSPIRMPRVPRYLRPLGVWLGLIVLLLPIVFVAANAIFVVGGVLAMGAAEQGGVGLPPWKASFVRLANAGLCVLLYSFCAQGTGFFMAIGVSAVTGATLIVLGWIGFDALRERRA